jgi:Domain of unknown function (DUF3471)
MALPIESYAGTYFHPGYLSMTLQVADSETVMGKPKIKLTARRANATWPIECQFEHVSGEYWLMTYRLIHNPGAPGTRGFAPVQFKLGSDGKVSSMGIEWRADFSDVVEGLIWFDKGNEKL